MASSTASRVRQSSDAISELAKTHPAQALQLLRATLGACRVEFLLQAMAPSAVTSQLAAVASAELKRVFAAILEVASVPDHAWMFANIPLRLGGLGLRDPTVSAAAARLASLINSRARAQELGAAVEHIDYEVELALRTYVPLVR